jgi:hypothetical protein
MEEEGKKGKVSMHGMGGKVSKQKRYEGGYFTIEELPFTLRFEGKEPESRLLCRKTLREKKMTEDRGREQNQQKMLKELAIVESVRNKKYLLQYYCRSGQSNIDEVLMERCEHSLHEYIYFFGDCLEV